MTRIALLLLTASGLLAACDDSFCGAYATEVDGVCVGEAPPPEPEPPDALDLLEAAQACAPMVAGEGLDFEGGCVEGVCVGDELDVAKAVFGETLSCTPYVPGLVNCTWDGSVTVRLPDDDLDGQPDSGTDALSEIQIRPSYAGSDPDGLGMKAPATCFVDSLGPPQTLVVERAHDGRWLTAKATWDGGRIEILDGVFPFLFGGVDGSLDRIVLR